jgi:ABC-type multidrug transport system fused ATPase/permease subunit
LKKRSKGLLLSGGELQRFAIAPVLLKETQIILLDEATPRHRSILVMDDGKIIEQGTRDELIAERA